MMKQTEIGLIPDDWEVRALGEICDVRDGTHDSPIYYDFGYPFVTSKNLINGVIDFTDIQYISKNDYDKINERSKVDKNDILFSMIGTIGKSVLVLQEPNFAIKNVALFKNTNKCNQIYLKQYLDSDICYSRMSEDAKGSTQTFIPLGYFRTFLVPLPPFPEQQRIAKALSDVDSLISTTEKLLQKKKNIKQGAMQKLLTGKKRIPGFAKSTRTKMTELGEIPEDWEVKTLSEIFEFKPNNTFTRDCLNDSKGEYQNVHYGDVLIKYPNILDCSKESIPFINEGINVKFSKYGIVEGDIIIADTAEDETVGKVVEILNLGEKKIVSGLHTFLCRKITDDFAPKWLGYFMNQAIFHNQLLPFITGTKVSAISRTVIQNVKVLIPPKEEQTAIANVLSSMDKEIETLNTKLEKYRNLKTAMMQQLLTGKVRLLK